jgi:hypothetical protein
MRPIVHRLTCFFLAAVLAGMGAVLGGCDVLDVNDPGNPNGLTTDALEDPSRAQIANLAAGLESAMRTDFNLYLTDVGSFGREYYRFSSSEPRFTADLLGQEGSVLDNNTFYLTRPWNERYRAVRTANILISSLDNVSDDAVLTDAEKNAARGFARTLTAYQLLLNANLTYYNGIRIDVAGETPGPIVPVYQDVLTQIQSILDQGMEDLSNASDAFPFALSDGFSEFSTPADVAEVNRALAARVAAYQGDYQAVLGALQNSFVDLGGDLTRGVYHVFSTDPVDIVNPFFIPPQNTGEVLAAHPSFVEDARRDGDGNIIDNRVEGPNAKVVERNSVFERANLRSEFGFFVYKSQTAPIPIIRNAELLLLRAEANILGSNSDNSSLNTAVADLNIIRRAAGLGDYDGPVTEEAVLDELMYQRRYELYGEGHRWVDVRRILAAGDPDCPADTDAALGEGEANRNTCLNDYFPVEQDGVEADAWFMFNLPQPEIDFGAGS